MSESTPGIPSSGAQIGIDQWVEQADQRTERRGGLAGRVTRAWERIPAAGKLALLTPAILVPFLPFISEGNLFNYGLFILIYALLALGLNVVVGFAGLLDLGYVAFFGFGAYTYAFLSGTHGNKGHTYTHHWDAQWSILMAILICALLGLFLGSSSRRLLGDYLAIVTLFFGRAFVVFTNAADPYGITNGSNGPANVAPLPFFGGPFTIPPPPRPHVSLRRPLPHRPPPALLPVPARLREGRDGDPVLHQRVEDRPRLEGVARGPARRGDDGHAGEPAEDHGLQHRPRDRRARRQRVRRGPNGRVPPELQHAGADPDLRSRDPRRHREPDRDARRRDRDHRVEPGARFHLAAERRARALLRGADRGGLVHDAPLLGEDANA